MAPGFCENKVFMNLSAENPRPELDLLSSHKRTAQKGVNFQGSREPAWIISQEGSVHLARPC